ncbi:MAG: glycosyltransferase family 39 protein [Sulfurimonas sp.]|nr:glycosyltransferase family 39 protein [Sulfurimonas sp.]
MTNYYKKELQILFAIFIFKIAISVLLPLTGDEAYFIKWADNLSMGYYDHPPMVGWIIHLMSYISGSHIFFRLFTVVTTFTAAFVIYKIALLYRVEKSKALLTSLIFLASPVDLLLILMTNDVALLFFSSLGTLFLLYSLEKKEWLRYSLLASLFLGSAFLSKYFAVFLMLSLLIFSFYMYKSKALKNVLIVTAVVSLFIAQNLYFNYNSCWNNILFNFFARTEDSSYNIGTPLGYFGLILYILTPWGVYFLFKTKFEKTRLFKLLILILSVAFFIFFVVSLKNKIGLHWFLIFTPYIFLLFSFMDEKYLTKLFKYNAIFTFLHVIILVTLLLIPTSLLKDNKKYSDIVMYTQPEALCAELERFDDERIFTLGYSTAALLSHYCKRDVTVLFNNSKYGRFDDKLLDVRTISDKDITIFNKSPINEELLNVVCNSYVLGSFETDGATFYTAKCNGFEYDEYKKRYLDVQNKKFYNIPSWLPVGECYFRERYYR